MTSTFSNVYEDRERARAYADLEFPGTYLLAFRDIPELIAQHVTGNKALDFGCGAGRSTRFIRQLGFDVVGVDISEAMLQEAATLYPRGEYLLLGRDDLTALGERSFDLIFSAFTFDNIPDAARRARLFRSLAARLTPAGRMLNLVSAPDIYHHEWLSFSTCDFPENRGARSGDVVRIIMLDVPDRRPVEDILWTPDDYARTYELAGLELIEVHRPLGRAEDRLPWKTELEVAPWTIYVLGGSR